MPSHGSVTKAGKTRDLVNSQRHSTVTKTHNKKHSIPRVSNRRKYNKLIKKIKEYRSPY